MNDAVDRYIPKLDKLLYTVPEFCALASQSVNHYWRMRAKGLMPKEDRRFGNKVLIRADDIAEWFSRLPTDAEKAAAEKQRAKLKRKSDHAASQSAGRPGARA